MKQNEPDLSTFFQKAKAEHIVFDQSQLRNVVEKSSTAGSQHLLTKTRRIRMITLSSAIVGCAITALYLLAPSAEHNQLSQPQQATIEQPTSGSGPNTTSLTRNAQSSGSTLVANVLQPSENTAANNNSANATANTDSRLNIAGTEYIHLNIDELHALGLDVDASGNLIQYWKTTGGSAYKVTVLRTGGTSTAALNNLNEIPSWFPTKDVISPSLISDAAGAVRLHTTLEGNRSAEIQQSSIQQQVVPVMTDPRMPPIDTKQLVPHAQNNSSEPEVTVFIYPDDTTWTEAKSRAALANSAYSKTKLRFIHLTREDVQRMKEQTKTANQEFSTRINKHQLVGVAIPSHGGQGASFVAWYDLSSALLQRLPARYATALASSMQSVSGQSASVATSDADNGPIRGCRLLENCRTASGSIVESEIYPNPAQSDINIRFDLRESRDISFSLHYLDGRQLTTLNQHVPFSAGKHQYSLALRNVENGVYLLAMSTNQGERTVHRLLVQR